MLKLALIIALQLHGITTTHHEKRYTLADLKADNPYTMKDWEKRSAAPYTSKAFDKALDSTLVCQCFTVKVSPEGNVIGKSRTCACDE